MPETPVPEPAPQASKAAADAAATIPAYRECITKWREGTTMTELEMFIHWYEPAGVGGQDWRRHLGRVLTEAILAGRRAGRVSTDA
jgi:hypothetical protein